MSYYTHYVNKRSLWSWLDQGPGTRQQPSLPHPRGARASCTHQYYTKKWHFWEKLNKRISISHFSPYSLFIHFIANSNETRNGRLWTNFERQQVMNCHMHEKSLKGSCHRNFFWLTSCKIGSWRLKNYKVFQIFFLFQSTFFPGTHPPSSSYHLMELRVGTHILWLTICIFSREPHIVAPYSHFQ